MMIAAALGPMRVQAVVKGLPQVDRSMDSGTGWHELFTKLWPNSSSTAKGNMHLPHLQHGAYKRYLHWLYNVSSDDRDQRPSLRWSHLDVLYLDGFARALLAVEQVILPPGCPMDERTPYMGRVVHAPRQVAWFRRSLPLQPMPNSSWVEITHCSGSRFERNAYWTYAARGSGLYVNVGRTIAFLKHEDAAYFFLGRACNGPQWCGGQPINSCLMQCNDELPAVMGAAKSKGFDSVQFVGHCDMRCAACGHEIVLLGMAGGDACSSTIEYRQGIDAEQPCDCVASPTLTSERGMCATCRGSRSARERGMPL